MNRNHFKEEHQQQALALHFQIDQATKAMQSFIRDGKFELAAAYATFTQKFVSELDKLHKSKVQNDNIDRLITELQSMGIDVYAIARKMDK